MKLSKEAFFIGASLAILASVGQWYYYQHYLPARQISVYYNQDIAANEKVIALIQNADKFVYFAVYTFTRKDIEDALLGAKYRGLDVRGLVDRDQTQGLTDQAQIVKQLREAGIPIAIDHHQGIMHLKTVVTDKAYASGSYNWTQSATEINDEVLEIGTDKTLRGKYQNLLTQLLTKYPAE